MFMTGLHIPAQILPGLNSRLIVHPVVPYRTGVRIISKLAEFTENQDHSGYSNELVIFNT